MTVLFYFIYLALGAGAGWGMFNMLQYDLTLSLMGGGAVSIALSLLHLFVAVSGKPANPFTEQFDTLIAQGRDAMGRLDVLEARADALESSLRHELTERRDALVSEMRQLETLIGKLSQNFDSRLATAETSRVVEPQEDAALRLVKEALLDGRVDLHLQPIVSLPQRRVSFYEGFTRLRGPDGALILPATFLDAARRANLMGLLDNMMLYRSVEIVRRLAARDRRVGVFCNVSVHSLQDPNFFPLFLEHMEQNRDLAGALIFEVRADRFDNRSREMRDAMEKLTALGFRFSIDHAPTLELDLPRLQDAGVRFVKIRGEDLIEQIRDPNGPRPNSSVERKVGGEEVSSVCSRYGVTLIAEKMEEEVSVVEVLDYGIPYGQGHVFGAPRPIKSSLMEETSPPPELIRRLTAIS